MTAKAFRLEDFGSDLCERARSGELDPVACRPELVHAMMLVLARRTKRCPVLIGEPGVGKSALVEGLAADFATGEVPEALRGCTIFALDLGALLAGTPYRGDFEGRLRDLVSALRESGGRRILFVDEIHLLERAGRSEGGIDAANLLKPLLARGALPCIGATTPAEWEGLVERDPALERRFQVVRVPEPSREQVLEILRALRPRLEGHHRVRITDAALQAAVDHRPKPGAQARRALPDHSIDLLDMACSRLALDASRIGAESDEPSAEREAMDCLDFEGLARLRNARRRHPAPPAEVRAEDVVA